MLGDKRLAIYQPRKQQTMMHRTEQTPRFPQAQLMLLYFLMSSLFVKVYKPLLRLLSILGRLLFCCLTVYVAGIFNLWRCSLQMSFAVHIILVRKLGREILTPAAQILQHFQAAISSFCFYWVGTLQYCAARWVLGSLLVLLKQRTLLSILSGRHQLQENRTNYWTALQPVMKQIATSLFIRCRDGFPEVFHLSAKAGKYILSHASKYGRPTWDSTSRESISDDITSVLPKPCVHLHTHFKGPAMCILKEIPQTFGALKFVVAREHIISGPGRYGLDVTNIPLNLRFQRDIKLKYTCSSLRKTSTMVTRVKAACVIFIALYLSMFSNAIKMK